MNLETAFNIIRVVIVVIGAILEMMIVKTFADKFLSATRFKNKKFDYILCVIFVTLSSLIGVFLGTSTLLIVSTFVTIFLFNCFYKSSLSKKILVSAVVVGVMILSEIIVLMGVEIITNYDIRRIKSDVFLYIVFTIFSKFMLLVFTKIIFNFKEILSGKISKMLIIPLFLTPVATILFTYIAKEYAYSFELKQLDKIAVVIVIMILLIVSNLFAIYLFENQVKVAKKLRQQELVEERLRLNGNYYKEIIEKQRLSRKTVHDTKNKLFAISTMLDNEQIGKAREELSTMLDNIYTNVNQFKSGNDSLDALLNSKNQLIEKYSIKFNSKILMSKMKIDDIDLCVVVGNALDNAIESCEKVSVDKRYIDMKIVQIGENLIVEMENAKIEKNTLTTSKSDKFSHGFGIKSIEDIANKYNGYVVINNHGDKFNIKILLGQDIDSTKGERGKKSKKFPLSY